MRELVESVIELVLAWSISFVLVAFLTWVAAVSFGFEWTWLKALGCWAVVVMARMVFKQ